MIRLRAERGFTLAELIVAMGIAIMILYAVFIFMRISQEHMQAMGTKMTIQDSAREGLYKMIQEIRLSAPNQVVIDGADNTITFKIPDPDDPMGEDYRVDWDNAREIVYALGGTNESQIIRTDRTIAKSTVIANDVAGITFEGDDADPRVVTVILEVQRQMDNSRMMTSTPMQIVAQAEVRNS